MTIKTILLDLDDTLLESNTNAFVAAYIQELFQALQPFISTPDEFRRIIWQSMAEMQANLDPTITNHQAFNRVFLSRLQGDEAAIVAAIDHFYKARYPTLQAITHVRPEAVPLVEALLRAGYQVVIATNPLYPQTAIEQRLDWAGVRHYPYALVTYMENSHFSKPNPAYYREILDKLNSLPAETLMVGNDPVNDIAPARSLGLPTWWITNLAQPGQTVETTYQGTLAAFLAWIQTHPTQLSPS